MLRFQVIGCGAAGNKAVINLVETNMLGKDNMSYLLINSTDKDIVPEYRLHSMIFGSNKIGGCGKERELGKKMLLEDMDNGIRSIDKKIDPFADVVVVCGSTEGGSGSASVPLVSKYIKQVLHIPAIAVLFFGFNDDARGMQNSIEICQELPDDVGVISICNSRFLEAAYGNKLKAEKLANDQFCKIMRWISGKEIYESAQNIDDTDLKKVITTPGYMSVEKIYLKGGNIKNIDQFNNFVDAAVDYSTSMASPVLSAKRIATIFNVKENADYIDYSASVFKRKYGMPYELFVHVQDDKSSVEYVTVIAVGQNLPIDEVKEIYEEYKKASESVNKAKDAFFSEMNALKGNPEDSMFNMLQNNHSKTSTEADKASFFKEFGLDVSGSTIPAEPKKKAPNVKNVEEY